MHLSIVLPMLGAVVYAIYKIISITTLKWQNAGKEVSLLTIKPLKTCGPIHFCFLESTLANTHMSYS